MAKVITNLTDKNIEDICMILDGWVPAEKLTWDALVKAIEGRLDTSWSRQALDRHTRIKQAFNLRKKSLRKSPATACDDHLPVDLRKALECTNRLRNENERLTLENYGLLEQFRRWAYNAYCKGITLDVLNASLPQIDRGGTRND